MITVIAPLVGMHFRPPAKLILEHLASGAELKLVPEPENPYDEKAIKVLVSPAQIPMGQYEVLREVLPGAGFDLDEVLQGTFAGNSDGWIHLGYVADSNSKLYQDKGLNGNAEVAAAIAGGWDTAKAKLAFMPDGKPAVIVEV